MKSPAECQMGDANHGRQRQVGTQNDLARQPVRWLIYQPDGRKVTATDLEKILPVLT